jgi:hypothetical protein
LPGEWWRRSIVLNSLTPEEELSDFVKLLRSTGHESLSHWILQGDWHDAYLPGEWWRRSIVLNSLTQRKNCLTLSSYCDVRAMSVYRVEFCSVIGMMLSCPERSWPGAESIRLINTRGRAI